MRTHLAAMCLIVAACARPPAGPAPVERELRAEGQRGAIKPAPDAQLPAEPSERVVTAVLEPTLLRVLESQGFGLGMLVEGSSARTTEELLEFPGFTSIFTHLKRDLAEVKRRYPIAMVTSVQGARLFESKFFESSEMSFALSGVFNRIDRRAFYGTGCGEIRFVYRLGYETKQGGAPMVARLPMTINVVFDVAGETCQGVAKQWRAPSELQGEALLDWLQSEGALRKEARKQWSLKAVETNIQTLRFQSTMHPKMAGHIEYLLRVFEPSGNVPGAFTPAPLENTPNVKALQRDRAMRAELLAYLRQPEVLLAIDEGIFRIPDKFLATRAMSVSPRGLIRLANRPFKQLFKAAQFADLDLSKYRTVASSAALLRRLDAASCMGCHQSRSIAGFHNLGNEPSEARQFDALYSGVSPHLRGDLERRRAYVSELALGNSPSEFRPFPERQGVPAGPDAPCGLGDPGFAAWTCQDGLLCAQIEDTEIGVCQSEVGGIGDACEYGTAKSGRKPLADRIENIKTYECGRGQEGCLQNIQAASQGMCYGRCGEVEGAGHRCSDFLDIDGFQRCLRQKGSYASCAESSVYPLVLRDCDNAHSCRSDYVCSKQKGAGVCVPTYFLFQLRTDGYPFRR